MKKSEFLMLVFGVARGVMKKSEFLMQVFCVAGGVMKKSELLMRVFEATGGVVKKSEFPNDWQRCPHSVVTNNLMAASPHNP